MDLRASCNAVQPPNSNRLCLTPRFSPALLDWVGYTLSGAIDVLERVYSRVVAVLKCSVSKQGLLDDSDIQANLEEAVV
jgi:hypothetical protein